MTYVAGRVKIGAANFERVNLRGFAILDYSSPKKSMNLPRFSECPPMRLNTLFLLMFGLFVAVSPHAASAGEGTILGLSSGVDELELYKTSKDDAEMVHALGADTFPFPTPILGVSKNGMYKIKYKGAEYWVISDDVKSSVSRKIDTACDPKMAGSVVSHGKRGAGEDCK